MNLEHVTLLAAMSAEGRFAFKIISLAAVFGTLALGMYFFKNQHIWFGKEADTPSDTSGGREYGRMQTWVLYWGMLAVFIFFALVF